MRLVSQDLFGFNNVHKDDCPFTNDCATVLLQMKSCGIQILPSWDPNHDVNPGIYQPVPSEGNPELHLKKAVHMASEHHETVKKKKHERS